MKAFKLKRILEVILAMLFEIGETLKSPNHYFAAISHESNQCCLCGKIVNGDTEMENHVVVNHKFKRKSPNLDWEKCNKTESTVKYILSKFKKGDKNKKLFSFPPNIKKIKKNKKREHKCSCGKTFNFPIELRNHEDRHHKKIKHFFCEYCSMGFIAAWELKKHLRVHTGERPYDCNDCDKKFKFKGNLDVHRRVHTGETPFECQKCGRKFKFAATRSSHRCIPA